MSVERALRTIDLAQAAQISVQQVRNFEALGLLPPVARGRSGYRRYTRQHLVALTAALQLVAGYGRPAAQQIMQALHQRQIALALAQIDRRHAELAEQRTKLDQTLAALSVLAEQLPAAPPPVARRLRVAEAARLAGVRVSALRFWEQQGLLQPIREQGSNYRLYDERQIGRLRIVVLLRQASYDFDAIRSTLEQLEAGQTQRAIVAIEQRRSALARSSWRCMAALAALHAYIREFLGDAGLP